MSTDEITGLLGVTSESVGSRTASDGFQNEDNIVNKFNNWETNADARAWLRGMGYNLSAITEVIAMKVTGQFKADVQVQVRIRLKKASDIQNLQVKLVSSKSGYNQVDKRWVDTYTALWSIPPYIQIGMLSAAKILHAGLLQKTGMLHF